MSDEYALQRKSSVAIRGTLPLQQIMMDVEESVTNGKDWEVLEGGVNLDKAREKVMHALIELDAVQDGEPEANMDKLMADLIEAAENLGLHDYLRRFGLG